MGTNTTGAGLIHDYLSDDLTDLNQFLTDTSLNTANVQALVHEWASQFIQSERFGKGAYPLQMLANENSKWVAMSMIQKGIRRGTPEYSKSAAYGLFSAGMKSTVWRRLSVISLEDLGLLGLPFLVFNMMMVEKRISLPIREEHKLACAVIDAMAYSAKDRSVCDSAGAVYSNCDFYQEAMIDVDPLNISQTKNLFLDPTQSFMHRARAYENMRVEPGPKAYLSEIMAAAGVPGSVYHASNRYKQNFTDCMWVNLPPMWTEVAPDTAWVTHSEGMPAAPMIAGLPACALDQYTSNGKRALAYFKKACAPVDQFFKARNLNAIETLGDVLFAVEGGMLDRSLAYEGRDELAYTVLVQEFNNHGLSEEEALELCTLVHDNLETLNYARGKVCPNPLMLDNIEG